jgi:MbtH protein
MTATTRPVLLISGQDPAMGSDKPHQGRHQMSWDPDEEDAQSYRVVIDREKQVSLVLANRKIPIGWRDAGFTGKKEACLNHIEEVWTDRRLLDLRP